MSIIQGPGSVRPVATSANTSADMAFLVKNNPNLPKLIQQNPGLGKFIDKHIASGAVVNGVGGGQASPVQWNAWFHSPASLGQDYNWKDQFVFVFQRGPSEKGKVDFGREGSYQGRLLGVYRLGDMDVPQTAKGKLTGGISNDGGFETQFDTNAFGKAGDKVEICFCTGQLDANGAPTGGWGTLGGYEGRQHDVTIGQAAIVPIYDHGKLQVLEKKPGGGFIEKNYTAPKA